MLYAILTAMCGTSEYHFQFLLYIFEYFGFKLDVLNRRYISVISGLIKE